MKANKTINLKLTLKSISAEGIFEGYAAVFGNKDSEGDIIEKGAFKRTIELRQGKWPILWQHDYRNPIGSNLTAVEDEHGLKVSGQLFLDIVKAKDAYAWLKGCIENGLSAGLSIGFRIVDKEFKDGIRYLKEIALVEYSIVTFPANDQAEVVGVKAVTKFQDFPLAPETRKWSASAAVKRAYAWAGGDDSIDWEKFGSIFLIYDADTKEKKESYHLPIADIIDGKATAVPRAIFAAAARLEQTDASATDKKAAQVNLEKYYKKMGKDSPFKADISFEAGNILLKAMDFNTALQQEMDERQLYDLKWTIECAKNDALNSVCEDESMTLQEKTSMVETIFDQYGKAMIAWYQKYLAMEEEEDPGDTLDDTDTDVPADPPEKAGRAISAATRKSISEAMEMHDQAYDMHRKANRLHSKGTILLASLLPYKTSQTDPSPGIKKPSTATDPTPTPEPVREDAELKNAFDSLFKTVTGKN